MGNNQFTMQRSTFVDSALVVVCTNTFFSVLHPVESNINQKSPKSGSTSKNGRSNDNSKPSSSSNEKSGSKSKSDIRKENEQLWNEYDSLVQEQKKLRQIVERLANEYEESKNFEIFRRYGRLKGMIKRTVLHIKFGSVTDDSSGITNLGTGIMAMCGQFARPKAKAEPKVLKHRNDERYSDMSTQDLNNENNDLQEQIKDMRRKNDMAKEMIDQMDRNYEESKRYMAFQRYRLMKSMVKQVTTNKIV